jgi:hypothetical protein
VDHPLADLGGAVRGQQLGEDLRAEVVGCLVLVAAFINYYLLNANSQLGTASDQIGYIPTNEYIARLSALYFYAGINADPATFMGM